MDIYQEGLIFHGKSCTIYMIFIQLVNVVCFVPPSERLMTELKHTTSWLEKSHHGHIPSQSMTYHSV